MYGPKKSKSSYLYVKYFSIKVSKAINLSFSKFLSIFNPGSYYSLYRKWILQLLT